MISTIRLGILIFCCVRIANVSAQQIQNKTQTERRAQSVVLKIGDPAPPLVAAKWVKGTPVTLFEAGQVYVVEFWATWCGPCRASMPHLSEVARKFRGKATVVSFDVMELIAGKDKNADYVSKVERFVKRLGDGMDYTVAIDVREGTMENTWMKAAGLYGIPAAFIIGKDGKIAWIGHPIQIEEPLGMIVKDAYDEAGKEKLVLQLKRQREKITSLEIKLKNAEVTSGFKRAIEIIDEILPLSPLSTGSMVSKKYEFLNKADRGKAHKYAIDAMKTYLNDPLTLQSLAMNIIENKEDKNSDYSLALKIMQQVAAKCDSEDPFATSNLAKAYFKTGNVANAIKIQQKVIDLLNDTSLIEQKQSVKDNALEVMEEYKSGIKRK